MAVVKFTNYGWLVVIMAWVLGGNSTLARAGESHGSRILVRFRQTATAAATQDVLRAAGNATVLESFSVVPGLYLVEVASDSSNDAMQTLNANDNVLYAEPDYEVHSFDRPSDPRFPDLWGMENNGQTGGTTGADIRAVGAWATWTGDPNFRVAVIDTGIDDAHPDLEPNVWTNPTEIPNNGIDDDGNGYVDDVHGFNFLSNNGKSTDDNGHGTHVSGTIGAVANNRTGVVGVNWRCKVIALKFLSAGGSGSTSDAIRAMQYVLENGIRVSNNSWGGGDYSQALYDTIKEAQRIGHLFIAAAGNDHVNNDVFPHYPSSYDLPNIISVAATDHNDELADFSNYGATSVDLAAPGVDILSTLPDSRYGTLSGTSMAAPHVAGVAALLMSRHPDWSWRQVKDRILSTARPVPSLDGKTVTGSVVNAAEAIGAPPMTSYADIALFMPDYVRAYIDVDANGAFDTFTQWGLHGDDFVGGDLYGPWADGYGDICIARPNGSGYKSWYCKHNERQPGFTDAAFGDLVPESDYVARTWGLDYDRVFTGDFDGDGQQEAAVIQQNPSLGQIIVVDANSDLEFQVDDWFCAFPITIGPLDQVFGGDTNGDGYDDLLIWRHATGNWEFYRNTRASSFETSASQVVQFGLPGDRCYGGDFDGDGYVDLLAFRPSNSVLYINVYADDDRYGVIGDVDRTIDYTDAIRAANIEAGLEPDRMWDVATVMFNYDASSRASGQAIRSIYDQCPEDDDKLSPGTCGCGEPDVDSDHDGVVDCVDRCPWSNDTLDDDQDGVPNGCDICPGENDLIDTDGDGVVDCEDECPEDPAKVDPGVCGCNQRDMDSDGDGVADCIDECPADRTKLEAGACGCGIADVDSDSDGTFDCVDECPSDPDKTAPGYCGCAWPDTDADADGVMDCHDACADTPAGEPVNEYGCPFGGACCFPNEACLDGVPQADCDLIGGLYRGDGTTCGQGCGATFDFDGDGVVTLTDLAAFTMCAGGPSRSPESETSMVAADCIAAFDTDGDGDVDLLDSLKLQTHFLRAP